MAVADVGELEWKKLWKHLREYSVMEMVGPYLISEFRDIRSLLEEEENHRRLMAAAPKEYLKLLRKLNNELGEYRVYAHQVMDKKKSIFRFNPLTQILFLRKRRKNLAQILQQMIRLEALAGLNRRLDHDDASSSNPVRGRLDHGYVDVDDIIGFDDMAKEIENVVVGDINKEGGDLIAYGITGMGGVGKTALALKVFCGTRICQEFPTSIWVSLSDVDMRGDGNSQDIQIEIVRYMLMKLNYELSNELRGGGIIQLLTELKERLSKNKYLIVLDGAWQENSWYLNLHHECHDDHHNSLCYGLPKKGGGAVIVTSRQEQFVKRMVGEHNFTTHLDPHTVLLQEICCNIFEHALGRGEIFKIDQKDVIMSHDQIEEVLLGEEDEYDKTIIGTGSSGTVQQVFNSHRICQKFPTRLWVSLSDLDHFPRRYDDIIYETIQRILHELDCNFEVGDEFKKKNIEVGDDDDDVEHIGHMTRELLYESNVLIVLDDVHIFPNNVVSFLRDLCQFLPIITNKGLAIVTTMKWYKDIDGPLSLHDYDYYFTKHLLPSCLEKIKYDIKYKIQGLPLAAKELAPIIYKQLLQLAYKKAGEGKSGVWPALELCAINT